MNMWTSVCSVSCVMTVFNMVMMWTTLSFSKLMAPYSYYIESQLICFCKSVAGFKILVII